jgi:hemerythrin-like metal-binding protein
MEKLDLTKDLITGNIHIDKQHREFLNLCSEAADCSEECGESMKIIAYLKKLEVSAEEHFSTEGKLMEESFYPDKKGHWKLHGHFIDELHTVQRLAESGETGKQFAKEIYDRLGMWFILHIKKNDLKLFSYIINK